MNSIRTNTAPLEMHIAENFSTLRKLCNTVYSTGSGITSIWNQTILSSINRYADSHLAKLNITIPPEEMETIFNQYGVIALRRLEKNKLTVFCGNTPLICYYRPYSRNEQRFHLHEDSDTVDMSVLMNPTIVTIWPPQGRSLAYFQENNPQGYGYIAGELMSAVKPESSGQNLIQIFTTIASMLSPENGICDNNALCVLKGPDSNPEEIKKTEIGIIIESAKEAGLNAEITSIKEEISKDFCSINIGFRVKKSVAQDE